ncbi:uncharacterized protein LOC144701400 [Wolffia australiana]
MGSFNSGFSSMDNLFIQNLIGRLQLRPPYLGTNSLLSPTLDDFLFQDDAFSAEDSDQPLFENDQGKTPLAIEEAKLEKEIIKIVRSGSAAETLKPNSGQSVTVGAHSICVGFHQETSSEYRVWEWHGHVMLFDEENGYVPEYIYGNYFERIVAAEEEEEEEGEKNRENEVSGLRELVGEEKDSISGRGRVLHRNSVSSRSVQ